MDLEPTPNFFAFAIDIPSLFASHNEVDFFNVIFVAELWYFY